MSETSLIRKLAEVMGEVERVPKRGHNDFHNYDYALEADVLAAVRKGLADRQVMCLPSTSGDPDEREITTSKGNKSTITTQKYRFTFVDGETGEREDREWIGQGDDPADKGAYKAGTGALKYFLLKTFLISTGDDPEGDRSTDERASNRQSSTRKPKPKMTQAEYLHTLVKRNIKDTGQLEALVRDVTNRPVAIEEGWAAKLSTQEVSALIDRLKNGEIPPPPAPVPTPPSDVPSDGEEGFQHAPQPSLEDAILEQERVA